MAKKITLAWTGEDIRKFIAQRIMFNYFTLLGITRLKFSIDDDKLYVDEKSIEKLAPEPFYDINESALVRFFKSIQMRVKNKMTKESHRLIEGRHIPLTDEINKQIITSLFPRKVKHKDKNGQSREVDIFEYLDTHFSLASGTTTPRIIVMFLDKCLGMTREYYRNNPDEKVPLDANGEYQLFKRNILKSAYTEFQKEITESFLMFSSIWKSNFNKFVEQKGKKIEYSFEDICKILEENKEEVQRFIAFICHIGYLKCSNPKASPPNRKYLLPVLFQR